MLYKNTWCNCNIENLKNIMLYVICMFVVFKTYSQKMKIWAKIQAPDKAVFWKSLKIKNVKKNLHRQIPPKSCRDFLRYRLFVYFYTPSLECYIGICVIFISQLKDIWLIIHHNHIPFWLKTKNAFVHLIAQIIRHFYL